MKYKSLRPDQIITLRDYPLYNEHILRIYYRIFSKNQGKILPPCPVIHKSIGIPIVHEKDEKSKKYNAILRNFLENHPRAEYFLLDGSHKTTSATLAHKLIPVVVIEKDKDLKECKKLAKKGEFFGWFSIENTIKQHISELAKHHIGTKKFLTVKDKAKLMIKNKVVPDYIISSYNRR